MLLHSGMDIYFIGHKDINIGCTGYLLQWVHYSRIWHKWSLDGLYFTNSQEVHVTIDNICHIFCVWCLQVLLRGKIENVNLWVNSWIVGHHSLKSGNIPWDRHAFFEVSQCEDNWHVTKTFGSCDTHFNRLDWCITLDI